jgi:hypothetical protein
MANSWFRLYQEFATDPKVQSMSEIMQRRLVMLFCLRCGNVLETLQEQEIMFALRITEEEWRETKQLFVSKCFIRFISDKCNIINWNKRQFISDTSTDRVKRYRAKKETFLKRSKRVSETPPDTDTDTDTDKETIQRKKERSIKPTEGKYGEFKNVLLDQSYVDKMFRQYGQDQLDAMISMLSTWKEAKHKSLLTDNAGALSGWVKREYKPVPIPKEAPHG